MGDKKVSVGIMNGAMVIILTCAVVFGVGVFLKKGNDVASGGAFARANIIESRYNDLRAQVLGSTTSTAPALLSIGVNKLRTNPLVFSQGSAGQVMGSFTISNNSSDVIYLKKVGLSVPPNSPMASVRSFIGTSTTSTSFSISASVTNTSTTQSISLSSTTSAGFPVDPGKTIVFEVTARPEFSRINNGLPFLTFISAEVLVKPNFSVGGQAITSSSSTSTQQAAIRISKSSLSPTSPVPAGTKNVTLGKFVFYGENSSYRITSLPFNVLRWQANGSVSADVTNIRLVDDMGVNIGSVIESPSGAWTSTGVGNQFYYRANFGSVSQSLNYLLPANTTRTIMIKGDIATTTTMAAVAASLVPASYPNFENIDGTPNPTIHPVVYGDPVEITSAPVAEAPVLSLISDGIPSRQLVMGSDNNPIYSVRLSAGQTEDIVVKSIKITDSIANNSAGIASLNNIQLYNLNTGELYAGPVNMSLTSISLGAIYFSMPTSTAPIIPRGQSLLLGVRAGIQTYISGGSKNGSTHTLSIADGGDVVAVGRDSVVRARVDGAPIVGAMHTVVSSAASTSKAMLSLPGSQTLSYHDRVVMDFIGTKDIPAFEWGATGDGVSIKTVKLDFSGRAIMPPVTSTTSPVSAFSVDLMIKSFASSTFPDATWGSVTGLSNQKICNAGIAGSCSVTFSLDSALIPNGVKTKKVWIRVDSSLFTNNSNAQDSLSVQIKNAGDITWSDGSPSSMTWNPIEMPMTVANIYYP